MIRLRWLAGASLVLLLASCSEPLTPPVELAPAPPSTEKPAAPLPTTVAAAAYNAQQPRAYEGDKENSITIQADDVFTIHNPDFSKDYTFTVQAIGAEAISITCGDPTVKITDVGFDDGKGLLLAFSLDGTFTKPIGWARFTPAEHIPVVQFYSIAAGGSIERDEG